MSARAKTRDVIASHDEGWVSPTYLLVNGETSTCRLVKLLLIEWKKAGG